MANSNPLIDQGTLNRLRGSVIWANFPQLNVTAPFLHKRGINLALDGPVTTYVDTMTAGVTSPEPYQRVNMLVVLLKTQQLSGLYKQRLELNSVLGPCTVRGDAATLPPYSFINCAIAAVDELSFNGEDPAWGLRIGGYYLINSNLFS
jgi:hypothetical protein